MDIHNIYNFMKMTVMGVIEDLLNNGPLQNISVDLVHLNISKWRGMFFYGEHKSVRKYSNIWFGVILNA